MTARRPGLALLVLMSSLLVASCDRDPQADAKSKKTFLESVMYEDPGKQAAFKSALKDAGIEYSTYVGKDGHEYVQWSSDHRDDVNRIIRRISGEPLPEGRHVRFGPPHHEMFKKWLTNNAIPFTTQLSDGEEYIVWKQEDYPRVSQWKHFPRTVFEKSRKLGGARSSDIEVQKSGAGSGQ